MKNPHSHRSTKIWDIVLIFLIIILAYSFSYTLTWLAQNFLYTDIDAERFASKNQIDLFVIGGLTTIVIAFYALVLISTFLAASFYKIRFEYYDNQNSKYITDSILIGVVLGLSSFVFNINILGRMPEGWIITGPSGNVYLYTPFLHLLLTFVASIVEELFFRGLCYTRLRSTYDSPKSILYTSIIFTLWHVHNIVNEPSLLLTNFVSGVALCWIFEKSKSLLPPIVLHISLNAVIVICSYITN